MSTKSELKKLIQAEIDDNISAIQHFQTIRELLKPFIGKHVSQRMATAVSKALVDMDYTVTYRNEYGMIHLKIEKKGIYWSDEFEYLLCHTTPLGRNRFTVPEFTLKDFDRHNTCYSIGREESLEKLRKADDAFISTLAKKINAYNKAREALFHDDDLGSYEFPVYFQMMKKLVMDEKKD